MAEPSVDPQEVEPRLYLIGPARIDAATLRQSLAAVLEAARPVGFLLRPGANRTEDTELARDLLEVAREQRVAFLVADDVDLARATGADGVHLAGVAGVAAARQALGAERILGAECGLSRHDAMVAGEGGADFVAFGRAGSPPSDPVVELIAWWQDIAVLPGLAHAATVEDAARLARAGADFIGVSRAVWEDADGPVLGARRLQAAIAPD